MFETNAHDHRDVVNLATQKAETRDVDTDTTKQILVITKFGTARTYALSGRLAGPNLMYRVLGGGDQTR